MIIILRFDVVLLYLFFFPVRLLAVTSAQYFDSSSHLTSIGPMLSSQTPAPSQRSTHYRDLIGLQSYYSAYHQISLTLARFGAFHTINTFTWLQAFRSKTKQWSQKFMVWLRRKLQPGLNQILYFHCISPTPFAPLALKHTHTHTLTHFLQVRSPQGPKWYPLSLRLLGLVCAVNPVTLRTRSKYYYHISTGVIRALFGAHVAPKGPRVCFEKAFFFGQSIYLPTIYCSKFPLRFPPSLEASWSPAPMPVQQREWGAVVSRRGGEQERGITDRRLTQQVLHWFCLEMLSNQGRNV